MIIPIIYGFLFTFAIASSIPPFLDARWFGRRAAMADRPHLENRYRKERCYSLRSANSRLVLAAFFGTISLVSAAVCWLVS